MSGLDVAAKLSARMHGRRPIPVALTGYGQSEDRGQTRAVGFDHHLVKPAPPELILQLIMRFGEVEAGPAGESEVISRDALDGR